MSTLYVKYPKPLSSGGGGTVMGSGASQQVAFWTSASAIAGNSALTFDGTNLSLAHALQLGADLGGIREDATSGDLVFTAGKIPNNQDTWQMGFDTGLQFSYLIPSTLPTPVAGGVIGRYPNLPLSVTVALNLVVQAIDTSPGAPFWVVDPAQGGNYTTIYWNSDDNTAQFAGLGLSSNTPDRIQVLDSVNTPQISLCTNGDLLLNGKLGVGNSAAATTPGTVVKKIEIFNSAGTSLGFIAIYDTIT